MSLSKRAVRPHQLMHLLRAGAVPVSPNYRLAPHVNVADGAAVDVRDAFVWAVTQLPAILARRGIKVDASRSAAVGWSSGGLLATSLAWTLPAEIARPRAILAVCAPLDLAGPTFARGRRPPSALPPPPCSLADALNRLGDEVATEGGPAGTNDPSPLQMLKATDPRSELLLAVVAAAPGAAALLHDLPARQAGMTSQERADAWITPREDDEERVRELSATWRAAAGEMAVPMFVLHGAQDDVAPVEGARAFTDVMRSAGVRCEYLELRKEGHLFDVAVRPGTTRWEQTVGPGYSFLLEALR